MEPMEIDSVSIKQLANTIHAQNQEILMLRNHVMNRESNPSTTPTATVPERFMGNQEKCATFLAMCQLRFNTYPNSYPSDSSKVAFICENLGAELQIGLNHTL
jgi:hypothetical protein